MQKVIIALGDPVVASALQDIFKVLSAPGILSGMNLVAADVDQIGLLSGAALTDSGVFVFEDEERILNYTPTVSPANYTIFYSYVESQAFGGEAAVLTMQPGLISPEVFSDGVLLGWFKYPGGSIPLNNSMFTSAARFQLGQSPLQTKGVFNTIYSPLSTRWGQASLSGGALTVSEIYDGSANTIVTVLTNTGLSLSTSTYLIPFKVPAEGLGQIQLEFETESAASLTVTLRKRDGTIVTPLETNFYTDSAMQKIAWSLPQGSVAAGEDICLNLFMKIQPTYSIRFRSFGISSYTEPF